MSSTPCRTPMDCGTQQSKATPTISIASVKFDRSVEPPCPPKASRFATVEASQKPMLALIQRASKSVTGCDSRGSMWVRSARHLTLMWPQTLVAAVESNFAKTLATDEYSECVILNRGIPSVCGAVSQCRFYRCLEKSPSWFDLPPSSMNQEPRKFMHNFPILTPRPKTWK